MTAPESGIRAGRFAPGRAGAWMLAGLLAAASLLLTIDPKLYINGDNVDYMFLARAVRGGDLWPSEKFPPLFPYLLAPVQVVFGMRLLPQKLLVMAFALGAVVLLARMLRLRVESPAGPVLLWISATLIPVVEFSHYVMSEVPFLFFVLGTVVSCDRWARTGRPGDPPRRPSFTGALRDRALWWIALCLAAALYTRSAGIAVAGGVLLWLLVSGRPRAAAGLFVLVLAMCLPWVLHSLSVPGGSPYLRQLGWVNPYHEELGKLTIESLPDRLLVNAREYFLRTIPVTIFPVLYRSTYSPGEVQNLAFPIWISPLLLVPLVLGLGRGIGRRDPGTFILLVYLGIICLWPPIWASARFLVPVAPLLIYAWWDGWRLPEERRVPGAWPRVRGLVLAILLGLGARNLVLYSRETRRYPESWGNYFAALEWVRAHTPEDALVIDRKPGFVEFVAQRKSMTFPRESDTGRMIESFRRMGATHVLLPSIPYDDIQRYLRPALSRERPYFRILHRTPDPHTYVLEFHPEGGAGTIAPDAE